MEEKTNNSEFLQEIVKELMEDETWELDQDSRFALVSDLEWSLLGL